MTVEVMKELLKSLPKRSGFGHDRKLDMLQSSNKILCQLHQRIKDYFACPHKQDIDKLLWNCCLDVIRLFIVLCEGKIDRVKRYSNTLDAAHKELHAERRSRNLKGG